MPVLQPHPSVEELNAFALGSGVEERWEAIEAHVMDCATCQERLASAPGDGFTALVQEAGQRSHAPAETPVTGADTLGLGELKPADAPVPPPELTGHPRYRLVRPLGTGGMGTVWLAEHTVMRRQVAIKVIRPEHLTRPGAGERFCREVHAAARLQHANVVTAFDAEQATDCLFLAMEYVEGESLAERVARGGPLSIPEACRAVCDAALGLQHALEHGLIHRDIKPQNLMAAADGSVKILDFGLASLTEAGAVHLTGTNVVMGTPDYIAPEQAEDPRAADTRSDIYSLGCTLYFLLSGSVPFPGKSPLQKLDAHRSQRPAPIRECRPEVPAELAVVLDKMTAKEPARRFQTPAEVAVALEPFTRATVGGRESAVGSRQSARRLVAVAAGLLLTGLAVAAAIILSFRTPSGTIEIQTDDPKVKIIVERNGEQVKILDPQSKQSWVLDTGDYTVRLEGNPAGLKIEPGKVFHLKRGDKQVVTVRRLPKTAEKEAIGEVRQVQWFGRYLYSTGFSPDGRYYFATGKADGRATRVWETATGKLVFEFTGNESAAFTPDSKRILCPGPDKALHLWDMATGKEIRTFEGHTDWVTTVAISPNGKRALSGSNDTTVRVWDLESGTELKKIEGHAQSSRALFAPDGKHFLTSSYFGDRTDRTLRLYDAATYKEVRSWTAPGDIWSIAPDGQGFLTINADWTVYWWNLKSDEAVKSLKLEWDLALDPSAAVGWSSDGRRLIYVDKDSMLRLVDLDGGKEIAHVNVPSAPYGTMAISPDGRFAVGANRAGWVYVWRLPVPAALPKTAEKEANGEVRQAQWFGRRPYSTGFSPDSRYYFATGGIEPGQTTTRVWETATGKLVREITGNEWAAFTPDGKRLLCAGPDNALHLWDMATGQEIRSFEGHTDSVRTVAISPDGKRALSGSNDTTVRVWDLEAGTELKKIEAHTQPSYAFFAPDGKHFLTYTCGEDRTLRLWDASTYKEVRSWNAPGDNWHAACAPDGQRFLTITHADRTVHWWDLKSDNAVKSLKLQGDPPLAMGFSEDCRRLIYAVPKDNKVRLVDLVGGKEIACFDVAIAPQGRMAISPDGRFAVGAAATWNSRAGWVYVWRLPAPTKTKRLPKTAEEEAIGEVRRVQWFERYLYSTGFSPDGRYYFATGKADGRATRVWETATGELVREFTGNECAAFTPDSKRILCPGPDKALHLWDMATGKEIRTFEGHTDWVTSVAISPNGKRALSGSNDRTVRVWDLESGTELKKIEAHAQSSRALFAPDGKHFLTWSNHPEDRTLRLHDAATYKQVHSWTSPGDNSWVALEPDGQGLLTITWTDRTVYWWNLKSDKAVKSLKLEWDPALDPSPAAGWSTDCSRLIYADKDSMVRLVDLDGGKEIAQLNVPSAPYGTMAISPDGRFAVGANRAGWVYVWRLPVPAAKPKR
jgi:WD40 repeat protein/tRNA A-37 threonylcarbamoyl transferase component Bud32